MCLLYHEFYFKSTTLLKIQSAGTKEVGPHAKFSQNCLENAIRNTSKIKTVGGIVPDLWIYIQEPDIRFGRLQVFNNWSPYMVSDLEHTVWLGLEYFCNEGDDLWSMDDGAFMEMAGGELAKIGIISPTLPHQRQHLGREHRGRIPLNINNGFITNA